MATTPTDERSRYLRARKFDLVGAISQFSETEQWMKEQHIIDLYENIDVEFYEHARLLVRILSIKARFRR